MKISYSVDEAAAEVGVSVDVIRRAIRGDQLVATYPKAGKPAKPISKALIRHEDLVAWLDAAAT
jgi:hypothetical protein